MTRERLVEMSKAVTSKGRTLHGCLVDAVLLPPSVSSTSFILPLLLLLLSVRLFALPDVSCQEEAARLSSVRTSDSHVDGLSQLPFLRSLKVSASSLRGPQIERRRASGGSVYREPGRRTAFQIRLI